MSEKSTKREGTVEETTGETSGFSRRDMLKKGTIASSAVMFGGGSVAAQQDFTAQPSPERVHVGVREGAYQGVFNRESDAGYRLVWIDGYDVRGETFFNVIFRPNDGTNRVARHGLTASSYQSEFDRLTAAGRYRLAHIESYLSRGQVRYATIFTRETGPAWRAYHGLTTDAHQRRFEEYIGDGFRPVNISVVSINGNRRYTGLYERRNVGSFVLRSFLTLEEYESAFDANLRVGRQPVYLNAYTHNGEPRICAIWTSAATGPFVARHGLSRSDFHTVYQGLRPQGYLTDVITGYADGGTHRFAAIWRRGAR